MQVLMVLFELFLFIVIIMYVFLGVGLEFFAIATNENRGENYFQHYTCKLVSSISRWGGLRKPLSLHLSTLTPSLSLGVAGYAHPILLCPHSLLPIPGLWTRIFCYVHKWRQKSEFLPAFPLRVGKKDWLWGPSERWWNVALFKSKIVGSFSSDDS